MLKRFFVLIIVAAFVKVLYCQQNNINKEIWIDSILSNLTLEQKIAQLLMPAVYPRDSIQIQQILKQIQIYNPGGVIIFQGGPKRIVNIINRIQANAKIPLLIGIDGEWGLSMRIDSVMSFPRKMMLGAVDDDSLIYQMGKNIAQQLKRMGIHTNFAPVVDINNNPKNPVIGSRSFGEDKVLVTRKALMYMNALQNNQILAVAKHFPGHGDTEVDSHYNLPVLNFSKERIDSVELYPFKMLIQAGVKGIMTAHLNIPAFDNNGRPASLSNKIIDSMLIKNLGFKGLIFTDALNMKGVNGKRSPKRVVYEAFMAKNDILLMPADIKEAIDTIKNAYLAGLISLEDIEYRCRKVLECKYWLGLTSKNIIDTSNLISDLNKPVFELTRRKIIESAITLLKNDENILPLKQLDTLKIAVIAIGDTSNYNMFFQTASLYSSVDFFAMPKEPNDSLFYQIYHNVNHNYNLILLLLLNTDMRATRNYGVNEAQINYIELLAFQNNVILYVFGSPYILSQFNTLSPFLGVVLAYEDNSLVYNYAAQATFGGIPIKGQLPVTINPFYQLKSGIIIPNSIRVKYTIPEEIGIDSNNLKIIDSVVNDAICRKAMPGCVIYLAHNNKVFFHQSYGYFTYDSVRKVKVNDLYDLASITKIAATTPMVMHLYEKNKIKLDYSISKYLSKLKKSNKADIKIIDILTHQAQLPPVINIFPKVLVTNTAIDKKNKQNNINNYTYYTPFVFQPYRSTFYPLMVADSLYVQPYWKDSIFQYIIQTPLLSTKEYKYSDVGFILLQKIIENTTKMCFNRLTDSLLYKPLGAQTLGYLPTMRFKKSQIAPTEIDTFFRKQVLQGTVHDPVAAMMGGIAGHAGLFSNANDLGKLMHVYLNNGKYGAQQYFQSNTIEVFTSAPFIGSGNRRGLGFDKPQIDKTKVSPVSKYCSTNSYGHTGFTGTMAWVDPDFKLVFIFLSNRTYPYNATNKLAELNVRTKIQDIVYQQLLNKSIRY